MFTTLIISATGLAIAAMTVESQADLATPPSGNPLVRPWTGPYGGVPPWDLAKPELFPDAFEAALAEQRAEIDAMASAPSQPTFENTIAAMERSGRTLDRVDAAVRRAAPEHQHAEIQALDANGSRSSPPPTTAIVFNPALFKRIETVYRSLPTVSADRRAEAAGRADLRRLRAPWRPARTTAEQKRLSEINQELATLFSDSGEGARRREHLDGARARGRPRRPTRSWLRAAKAAADERGLRASGRSSTRDPASIRS